MQGIQQVDALKKKAELSNLPVQLESEIQRNEVTCRTSPKEACREEPVPSDLV